MSTIRFHAPGLLGQAVTVVFDGTSASVASWGNPDGKQHIIGRFITDLGKGETAPLAGVTLTALNGADQVVGSATTGSDGRFDIATDHDGAVAIEASGLDGMGLTLVPASGIDTVFDHETAQAAGTTVTGGFLQNINGRAVRAGRGGLALNVGTTPRFLNIAHAAPEIVMLRAGYANLRTKNGDLSIDPVTFMPSEVPAYYEKIRVQFYSMDHLPSDDPIWGTYQLRINGLGAGYAFSGVGGFTVVSQEDDYNLTLSLAHGVTGNPYVDIAVPVSASAQALPSGWSVDLIRTKDALGADVNDLKLFDGTDEYAAIPATDARRIFAPDYLAAWATWAPDHIRFTKMNDAEFGDWREVGDYPTAAATQWGNIGDGTLRVPLEHCIALCNHLGCGMWWPMWSKASDALIDWVATTIRDTLDPALPVYVEQGNEIWNFGYPWTRYHAGLGAKLYGTQQTGTVSVTAGSNVVTGSGTSFDTVFTEGGQTEITFGEGDNAHSYAVFFGDPDAEGGPIPDPTTATSLTLKADAIYDATDLPFWSTGSSLFIDDAFAEKTVNLAQRFAAVFAGQRHRLITVMASQLNNPSKTAARLAPPNWSGEGNYVDPTTVIDAVAVNTYFGTDFFYDADTRAAFAYLNATGTDAEIVAAYSTLMEGGSVTIDGVEIDGATLTTGWPAMEARLAEQRDITEPFGLRTVSYEGGQHIGHKDIKWHLDDPDDHSAACFATLEILHQTTDATAAPMAEAFFRRWADLSRRFIDGPVMQFNFLGEWTPQYGLFSLLPSATYAGDRRTAALEAFRDAAPWWEPYTPPQVASVPDQVWTAGVAPGWHPKNWVSKNARSFTGTPPAGMTLMSNGTLLGSPEAGASGIYTFTAVNDAGSADITVDVTVV